MGVRLIYKRTVNEVIDKFTKTAYNEDRKAVERMEDMTEKEMKNIERSTIYKLRLIFSTGDKSDYTKDEILDILDKVATAKDQQ